MSRKIITPGDIRDHVLRLGEKYPPISLDSVDRTVHDPRRVRDTFGHVIDYLARVELEVDRNVLELLTLLPDVSETDRLFYADVWQPQEIQHGLILDRLQQDIDIAPADPNTDDVSAKIRLLGSLAHLRPVQEVARLLYYLTGAATEKSAVVAYNLLVDGLDGIGETAISKTVVQPIRRQEPGHFAFYRLSATEMIQQNVLAPWQLRLAKVLRRKSFGLVGAHNPQYKAQLGGILNTLGLAEKLEDFGAQIGLVERELLWARDQGMRVPDYIMAALKDTIEQFRTQGLPRVV
ncbi:GTP-binding protein LepA [Kineococcus sp. GCM10028916]|uniref:GTP-binding protein LepA n=1 Tax=Kineococcus sp. GCM10028916 TaxID=3273394 RepID=UPI003635C8B7